MCGAGIKLSVLSLGLGIQLERVKSGHPQQHNGRHERLHHTLKEGGVSERIWVVSLMDYDLGSFDDETCRPESAHNPLRAKCVTYVSGISRYPCDRNAPSWKWWP